MAIKLKVTYADERVAEILASPRAQVMTERQYHGLTDEARQVESSFYLAWASLHFAGQEPSDFEKWLDLVADVEDITTPPPDPTRPAQLPGTSSD